MFQTMLNRIVLTSALALIIALLPATASAADGALLANCDKPKDNRTTCDVRIGKKQNDYLDYVEVPKTPKKLQVRWDDGPKDDVEVKRYNDDHNKTAWLLMVDSSGSLQPKTLERIKTDLKKIVGKARENELLGLATFSDRLDVVAWFDERAVLEREIDKLERKGKRTEINHSTLQAINRLKGYKDASRKAIVLVTDGREEGTIVTPSEVIEAARENDIVIYSFGYVQENQDRRDIRDLKRIATETGGPYRFVDMASANEDDRSFFPELVSNTFFKYMQNGGEISFDVQGNDMRLVALDDDDKPIGDFKSETIKFEGDFKPKEPEKEADFSERAWERWVEMFGNNTTLAMVAAVAIIVVLLGLLALALAMLLRSPASHDYDEVGGIGPMPVGADGGMIGGGLPPTQGGYSNDGYGGQLGAMGASRSLPATAASTGTERDTVVMPTAGGAPAHGGDVLAWLDRIDGTNERVPVHLTNTRIGRHDDNDLRFDGATVHRRHAVLHMTPSREFIITDLSGEGGNGVKVNSKRIAKQSLKGGDIVEIGEVRLRFHPASS